jgi:hypothetical protein
MAATKAQLREEIRQLRHVGQQMSNVCFNVGQESSSRSSRILEADIFRCMRTLQKEWDGIPHAETPTRKQGGNVDRPSV